MFGRKNELEQEFFDAWETCVFELAAMNYDQGKIAEMAVNKVSTDMMRKHNLSMPQMVSIVEKAMAKR